MSTLSDIKEKGIVGAGGAGFPTHAKLAGKADTVIVNAAECEPLLHKDKEILQHRTSDFLNGLRMQMELVGAKKGIIGIKEKHKALIATLQPKLTKGVELFPLRDYYPAGDEITLIYETTGKVIKAGKLPISEGIVVNNVESVFNIASKGPVITKFLNVAGCVDRINTFEVPLGTSFREIINYARPTMENFAVLVGGPMMGRIADNLDEVVTKTTAALVILPVDHILVSKYDVISSRKKVDHIGKSACDQCTICTELCPRYLLGHPIQPHKAMRSLVFKNELNQTEISESHTLFCCECNLCSFIACPEALFPSTVCINSKRDAAAKGVKHTDTVSNVPHPLADYRRVASKRLKSMLDLNQFKDEGPLADFNYQPDQLKLLLKQHIGATATPIVKLKDKVRKSQKIATVADQLGSEIHAPMDAEVIEISDVHIKLRRIAG